MPMYSSAVFKKPILKQNRLNSHEICFVSVLQTLNFKKSCSKSYFHLPVGEQGATYNNIPFIIMWLTEGVPMYFLGKFVNIEKTKCFSLQIFFSIIKISE